MGQWWGRQWGVGMGTWGGNNWGTQRGRTKNGYCNRAAGVQPGCQQELGGVWGKVKGNNNANGQHGNAAGSPRRYLHQRCRGSSGGKAVRQWWGGGAATRRTARRPPPGNVPGELQPPSGVGSGGVGVERRGCGRQRVTVTRTWNGMGQRRSCKCPTAGAPRQFVQPQSRDEMTKKKKKNERKKGI